MNLMPAGKPAFTKGGRIVVLAAPPGVGDTAGNPQAGDTTLVILPEARGLVG